MDPFSFLLKELNPRRTIHPVSFLSHFMTWFQGLFYHWCEPITVVTQWSCSGPGSDLNWQCTVGTASHSEPCATSTPLKTNNFLNNDCEAIGANNLGCGSAQCETWLRLGGGLFFEHVRICGFAFIWLGLKFQVQLGWSGLAGRV